MLAALAGGAALMGRGKKKFGTDAGFLKSGAAGGASLSTPPILGTDHITRKSTLPTNVKKPIVPVQEKDTVVTNVNKPIAPVEDTGSDFQTKFTKKVDGKWMGPGQIIAHRKLTAGNQIPPSMRGGAETAQGFVRRVPIKRTGRGRSGVTSGWTTQPYKKGGRVKKARVTGIAKRGFGRALGRGKK